MTKKFDVNKYLATHTWKKHQINLNDLFERVIKASPNNGNINYVKSDKIWNVNLSINESGDWYLHLVTERKTYKTPQDVIDDRI